MNGCGAIADNEEAKNNSYIVGFTSVPYTILEYLESDVNQLPSGEFVCNSIYTYPGRHKSRFHVD